MIKTISTGRFIQHKINKKILFLGDNNNKLFLYLKKKTDIKATNEKLTVENAKKYDFIISYGYRHIIKKNIINLFQNKIINLHISFLPYNRGADPNLWSFVDNTPKGVTIHKIDEGIDTGDIILQKEIFFNNFNEITLKSTYNCLHHEIQQLFINNFDNIINNKYTSKKQNYLKGTYHKKKDKDKFKLNNNWDIKISELIDINNKLI